MSSTTPPLHHSTFSLHHSLRHQFSPWKLSDRILYTVLTSHLYHPSHAVVEFLLDPPHHLPVEKDRARSTYNCRSRNYRFRQFKFPFLVCQSWADSSKLEEHQHLLIPNLGNDSSQFELKCHFSIYYLGYNCSPKYRSVRVIMLGAITRCRGALRFIIY